MSACSTRLAAIWYIFSHPAMAIAQLTHLHISIPASGGVLSAGSAYTGPADPRRISFTSGVTVLGDEPIVEQSSDKISVHRSDIQIHDPVCPDTPDVNDMDISDVPADVPIPVLRPPRGFCTRKEWGPDGNLSTFNFSDELPGWFPWMYAGLSVDPPSLPISPIIQDSLDDSVVANVGSSRDETNTSSEAPTLAEPAVEDIPVKMDVLPDVLADSPPADVFRPVLVLPVDVVSHLSDCRTPPADRRSPGLVPRWRLAGRASFLRNALRRQFLCLRLCFAVWRVWGSPTAPSPVPRMDWHAGVCQSVRNGTGEVVTFLILGPGHGCGYPAASGCLPDDN